MRNEYGKPVVEGPYQRPKTRAQLWIEGILLGLACFFTFYAVNKILDWVTR